MEAAAGSRLLADVEEMSLEEALDSLRTSVNGSISKGPLKTTHMQELDEVVARHFRATQAPTLAICGRHEHLLYKLAGMLVSPPHLYCLLIIDLEGRFDATRLACEEADARHIYVHRPSRPSSFGSSATDEGMAEEAMDSSSNAEYLRKLVSEAGDFMLYGSGAETSASRRWWGTIVVGGPGAGDVVAGWKGWLRISRENVQVFTLGLSAEEALERRSARQDAVDTVGWAAESPWGGFVFKDGG